MYLEAIKGRNRRQTGPGTAGGIPQGPLPLQCVPILCRLHPRLVVGEPLDIVLCAQSVAPNSVLRLERSVPLGAQAAANDLRRLETNAPLRESYAAGGLLASECSVGFCCISLAFSLGREPPEDSLAAAVR